MLQFSVFLFGATLDVSKWLPAMYPGGLEQCVLLLQQFQRFEFIFYVDGA